MMHENRYSKSADSQNCAFAKRNKWYLAFMVVGLLVTMFNVAAYMHFSDAGEDTGVARDPGSFLESHAKKSSQGQQEDPISPKVNAVEAKTEEETNEVPIEKHHKHGGGANEEPPATKHHHHQKKETKAEDKHRRGRHHNHHKEDHSDLIDDEVPQSDDAHDRREVQNIHKVALGNPEHKKVFQPQEEESTKKHHHHQKDGKTKAEDKPAPTHYGDSKHGRHHKQHHSEKASEVRPLVSERDEDEQERKHSVAKGPTNNSIVRDYTKGKYSYDDAVRAYHRHLKEQLSETLEQSSSRFSDIHEAEGSGVLLPTGTSDDLKARFGISEMPATDSESAVGKGNPFPLQREEDTSFDNPSRWTNETGGEREADEQDTNPLTSYCDPTNADYTLSSDLACMRYLSDIRNMQSIKVMSSILSTGRTIKMKVFYRHNNVEAVLKVSQKKFALEPVSEVMAFHTDRVLGLRRVPPVIWSPIPIDFLRAAAAQVSNFYSQWLQVFALDYETSKPLISKCYEGGEGDDEISTPKHSGQCVNVSIQLWLFDVHDAEDTVVSPPRKYRHLLNVPFPSDGESVDDDDEDRGRHRKRFNQKPVEAQDKVKLSKMSEAEASLIKDPNLRIAAGELMDEFMFDYIIGNTDRWFGHNSFALGGAANGKPGAIKTASSPRLAFIDQGSSFYGRSGPEMNPFTKNTGPFCRFKASTARSVLNLLPGTKGDSTSAISSSNSKSSDGYPLLAKAVKKRLPKGIFHLSSHGLLKAAGTRADRIADHLRDCLSNFTNADVLYF